MTRRPFLRLFYGTMSVVAMIIIFLFSAQPGEMSSLTSHGFFSSALGQFLISFLPSLGFRNPETTLRKYAHMAEFAFLGFWVMLWMREKWKEEKSLFRIFILCVLFCALYACTDELHQFFVPQRALSLKDVLFDTTGSFASAAFVYLVLSFTEKRRDHA